MEHIENIRQWYLLRIELIENDNEKTRTALEAINDYFLKRNTPLCFNPYDERSVLVNGEREFEEICNSMEDSGVENIRDCTVFEFYSKVQFLEKKVKKMNHAHK